jgi:hypothetical protein
MPPTGLAHVLLAHAEAGPHGPALRSLLYGSYWTDGADIADPAVLCDVAAKAGLDVEEVTHLLADRVALAARRRQMATYRRRHRRGPGGLGQPNPGARPDGHRSDSGPCQGDIVPAKPIAPQTSTLVARMDVIADRYELMDLLGHGGMARVYAARDRVLDRRVAIKLLRDEIGRDAILRERFLREAKLAARLNHTHIVRVYDAGIEATRPGSRWN